MTPEGYYIILSDLTADGSPLSLRAADMLEKMAKELDEQEAFIYAIKKIDSEKA